MRAKLSGLLQGLLRQAPMGSDGVARIAGRQIYIVPTPMGLIYALAVFAMLLGSLNYQNNLGLLFAFFLTGVGLVAMHHCWFNLLGLRIQARPGPPVFAGHPVQFEVSLHNERAGARFDLRLAGGLVPSGPAWLAGQDQQALVLTLATARRGLMPLGAIEVETRHPMHLFRAWCYAQTNAAALIYPSPAPAAPPPVPDAGDGRGQAGAGSAGSDDYLGPREYRHGDSPRRLDWKVLARERGLVVKQFEGDEGLDVWIDWGQIRGGDMEGRISVLTRQVLDAATVNQRFGMRLPGQTLGLGRGEGQVRACLEALAYLPAGPRADAERSSG